MNPIEALAAVLLLMLAEQRRSVRNERALRSAGAFEPTTDVERIVALDPFDGTTQAVSRVLRAAN